MNEYSEILTKIDFCNYSSDQLPYSILPLFFERISTRELLHSDIIASLVDPNSAHNSDVLLRGFLNMIGLDDKQYGSLEGVQIDREKKFNGRPIDLLITWSGKAIIVENKLNNAVDQCNQLRDYYNSVRADYEVLKVVYMPLSPNKAASISDIDCEDADMIRNIYPNNLIEWLNYASLDDNPTLRANATAYANLLRYINQQYKNQMKAEQVQQNSDITEQELAKLIEISQIINDPAWNSVRLKAISEQVIKKISKVMIDNGSPVKNSLQLYLTGYKYWVEVWAYPREYNLWIASDDDNHPVGFEFIEKAHGYNYFKNPDKFSYKYPSQAQTGMLISDIVDILEHSTTK